MIYLRNLPLSKMDCQNNDDSTFLVQIVQTRKVNKYVRIGPYPGIIGLKSLNDFIATQESYD